MPPKRKRAADSGSSRPAPHRPANTTLGQHDRSQDGASRYGGRGGGAGRSTRRRDSSQVSHLPGPSAAAAPTTSPTLARPSSASSQHAAPILNTASSKTLPSAPPSPIPTGFHYSIVTDECLGHWVPGGRKEVIDHGIQSRNDEDCQELSTIFQELLQSSLDYRLKAADGGSVVKEIIGPRLEDADKTSYAFDSHTLLLDTVSVYIDIESGTYQPSLRDFLSATGVDPMLMRIVLEPSLLDELGLIRDTFSRIGIRQATNILYKQANYNLLREETEGYSKLATELFTTSNSEPPSAEAVQAAFERLKGLIGTFDLDVGRVLDVTLDVFGSVLIKQSRFFVKLLRISSWWPRSQPKRDAFIGGLPKWALPESSHWTTSDEDEAILAEQRRLRDIQFWGRAREIHLNAFFELGGRQVMDDELSRLQAMIDAAKAVQQAKDEGGDGSSQVDSETEWVLATKTLPPQGNGVAAQLLGFKLRFYDSEAKDASDVLPANIFYMSALLIKIGFISLVDLYPHVSPADDKMEDVREARMKILEEDERDKTGTGRGALAMLGVLPEDEKDVARANKINAELKAASAAAAAAAKVKAPEVHYQKVMLLNELLTLGAIPESLFILGRFPWLVEAFPDLVRLINRLLHHSINKVFQDIRPRAEGGGVTQINTHLKKLADLDQAGVPKGSARLGQIVPKRPFRWPHPDGEKDNCPYRCYWDEWADNVPVCQTVDDIFTLCGTLMNLSSVNIGKDPALLTKLAGIGAASLAQDPSSQNMSRWQDLLKRLLVPALSLTESNSYAVHAVWDLLRLYPITVRYNIYAEWFLGQTSRNPAIKSAFRRTKAETNGILKRLSLQNLSAMAKKLAKTAYASPGVVFKTALDQIEAYPNLIQAFVECARYFTDLGYDVLTWSLMSSLGGETRSRTQEDSILLTSKWLQALSKLSGRVFKRYQNMKPSPVLQYVDDQLSKGTSTDLVILRELISTMAGVVPDADFTDAQLKAMTGGEVLRRQTLINLGDRRFESVNGAKRLMQSLLDTKLAGRLLINLAQHRQSALFKVPEEEAHIKYMATITDELHQSLTQYLDLLRSNLAPEQFDTLMPGIVELMNGFGLDVSLAFMIGRASLTYRMTVAKTSAVSAVQTTSRATSGAVDADGDVSMNGDGGELTAGNQTTGDEGSGDKMPLDDKDSTENSLESSAPPSSHSARKSDPIIDVLQPVIDGIQRSLPPDTWERMSPEFYVTFWSLTLGDLHVPQSSYESEHDRLNKDAEDVMKDRSDMTRQGMNRKDEKKRALVDLAKSIREEMMSHVERYQKTRFRLAKLSKFWFPGAMSQANLTSDYILEHCLLPRLLVSAIDTEYCFRIVKFLHENRTPNFKLFALYEQLFNANRLRSTIFSCTVREAEHFGRFLKCILEDLSRWHSDKAVFEKEALGQKNQMRNYLGFATAFDEEGKPTAFMEHPFFRDAHYEWHKNLNIALKACLAGTTEWMHVRNAITVLKVISDFFPAVNFMGNQLLKVLDEIKQREEATKGSSEAGHRVDLAVTAQTVFSALKKREAKWIAVQAFRPNMSGRPLEVPKDVEADAPATSSDLRPTAPEFKPQQPATLGNSASQAVEVEDGEVKDGKEVRPQPHSDASTTASARAVEASSNQITARDNDKPNDSSSLPVVSKDKATTQDSRPVPSKSAAATPASSSGSRPDTTRSVAVTSKPERIPHGLPNRPDVPIPGNYRPERFGQVQSHDRRDSSRDARELREPREIRDVREHNREPRDVPHDIRDSRDHRPPESGRSDRRDHHGSDRRNNDSNARDLRAPERDWPGRSDPAPRRGELAQTDRDSRPSRDRVPLPTSRDGRTGRDPSAASQHLSAEEPLMNPERAALFQADDRSEMMNPARAALIQSPPIRSPRDNGRDRISSRTQSPRRDERYHAGGLPPSQSRDDRQARTHHSEHHVTSRDVYAETPPQASRDRDQPRELDRGANDRLRDSSFPGPQHSRAHDSDRARVNQQDPNYGRLNPVQPVADIPQGPRGRGGRNSSRLPSMNPPSRPDGRVAGAEINRPASPDRHPPTGPSSSRPRRSQPGQFDQTITPAVVTTSSPVTGMHPDRARQLNPSTPQSVSVHPERLTHLAPHPPPPPGPPPHTRGSLPPVHTSNRAPTSNGPLGSRVESGSLPSTPVSEQNVPYSTPTGPSSANERSRGGGRRQLAGIQNHILNQEGGRGNNGRRTSQRMSLAGSDAQILTGASPVSTPVSERQDPMRRDLTADRPPVSDEPSGSPPRESRGTVNGDDFSSSRTDHDRGGRRDHRDRPERLGRHSGRESRERSPRVERDVKDLRDYRDRQDRRSGVPPGLEAGGDRDPNHVPVQPRRSMRESTGGTRELLPGGGRESSGMGREFRHRGEGRGDGPGGGRMPSEDWNSGSRGGPRASGGPRDISSRLGDDRRDIRGDDRGRKRRSGEDMPPPSDREKRPRR